MIDAKPVKLKKHSEKLLWAVATELGLPETFACLHPSKLAELIVTDTLLRMTVVLASFDVKEAREVSLDDAPTELWSPADRALWGLMKDGPLAEMFDAFHESADHLDILAACIWELEGDLREEFAGDCGNG